jgi:hypothetical protein
MITPFTISRSTFLLSVLISVVLILFSACEKDEFRQLSIVPEIELLSVSKDTIIEFADVLNIEIAYQDGDGDIGFEQSNQYALFVRDIRLAEFDGFYIGPILAPGVSAPIIGTFNVELPSLFIFGNTESEQTRFEIKLVDRANNESNIITTPYILIQKP